jgi:hypothetical protein
MMCRRLDRRGGVGRAHAVQTVLETHVRAHLGELAELRPEFQ